MTTKFNKYQYEYESDIEHHSYINYSFIFNNYYKTKLNLS